jgi:hypothetical protein
MWNLEKNIKVEGELLGKMKVRGGRGNKRVVGSEYHQNMFIYMYKNVTMKPIILNK